MNSHLTGDAVDGAVARNISGETSGVSGAEKESNKLILNQDSSETGGKKGTRKRRRRGKEIYDERTFRVSTIISPGVS